MDKQWFNRSNRNLLGVNKIIRWRLRLNVTGFRLREVQELSRWPIYGPVDTKNAQHLKVTKMHWHHTVQMVMETLVTIGEKSYNRFHWPPGALFDFSTPVNMSGQLEKSQNPKSFSKIWLWKQLYFCVIFSYFVLFFSFLFFQVLTWDLWYFSLDPLMSLLNLTMK